MSSVRIYKPGKIEDQVILPFIEMALPAGFPSPAAEYMGDTLDLNEYLISNTTATYFARVEGDSMMGAGIYPGDVLVVDRSIEPVQDKIVIAAVNNEFTVKRLCLKNGVRLVPENENYEPIIMTGLNELQIWGVVTSVIRKL